jgi:hypothetical protein
VNDKKPKLNSEHPGRIEIDEVILRTQSGISIDIKFSLVSLEIYESLYGNYLEGSMTIEDSKNIRSQFSFNGTETVEISFRSPRRSSVRRIFRVIDMSDPIKVTKTTKTYAFTLVSNLYQLSISKKISKSFVNQERSKIVEGIYRDLIQNDSEMQKIKTRFDVTDGTTSIIIPFWNHIFAINRITAQSEYSGANDFLFYESLDSINFVSLSSFKTIPPKELLSYAEGSTRNSGGSQVNWELEMKKILNYNVNQNYNSKYSKLFSGELSGENLNFDMTKKKIRKKKHSYIREFIRIPHIEKYPMIPPSNDSFSSKFQSKLVKTETSTFLFNDIEDNNNIVQNYFKRNSHLSQMNLSCLNLLLYGDTKRKLGDVVEIEIPNVGGSNKQSGLDMKKEEKYLSGKYMITSIGHHITPEEYKMSVDVCRDSLPEAIPDVAETTTE